MMYGNERAKMPSKLEIAKHWGFPTDNLSYCWGCGIDDARVHRAHLLAKISGGDNNPDNFVLLCKFCHDNIQEDLSDKESHAKSMRKLFKNVHLPFFQIRYNFIAMKLNAGLYPSSFCNKLPEGVKATLLDIESMSFKLTKNK